MQPTLTNNVEGKDIVGISNCRYLGLHIRTLVLKFLLLYCRPLVEEGRVYCGLSPLYHVSKGTKQWKYFIDKDDVISYVRKEFIKTHEIKHLRTKKVFSSGEISNLINRNENYDLLLNHIASNYAIYPILLEDIMIARDYPFKRFKKVIESKYPYLRVYQKKNTTIIEGLADDGQSGEQTIIMTPQFMQVLNPLLPYIDNSEKRYLMNNHKVGLFEVISTFRASVPKNMERAKGLGALDAREIGISTLAVENRKLLRYTVTDINKEIELMRKANDDKFSLIRGIDISQYEF